MSSPKFFGRTLLLCSLLAAAPVMGGCRAAAKPLYAAPSVQAETLFVSVRDAHIRGDRVIVKTWMQNRSEHSISIDRQALGLRLEDGRVLPRAGRTHPKPYLLAPGEGHAVHVVFRAEGEDLRSIENAHLVLDGIDVIGGPEVKLGEIALMSHAAHRAQIQHGPQPAGLEPADGAMGASSSEGTRAKGTSPKRAPSVEAEAEDAIEDDAETDDEGLSEEDSAEEAAQDWEIGTQ